MPAPPGNRNALKHGRYGFSAGRWPRGCSYITRLTGLLRRHLEDAVCERHGEVTVYHCALISSACRHEARALLVQRWLREAQGEKQTETTEQRGKTLSGSKASIRTERQTGLGVLERTQLLREISAASDSRDKCLERLGLDKSAAEIRDVWAQIYAEPLPPTPPDAAHDDDSPPDGQSHSPPRESASERDSRNEPTES